MDRTIIQILGKWEGVVLLIASEYAFQPVIAGWNNGKEAEYENSVY